jgi:hypothetical protein
MQCQTTAPLLFITGFAEKAVLSHGHIESGMSVLTKPFAMEVCSRVESKACSLKCSQPRRLRSEPRPSSALTSQGVLKAMRHAAPSPALLAINVNS